MDCLDDDWIDNEVDDRGLLEVLDGLDDGLTNDDDDHELLRDMDCLDGGGIDGDIDDRGLLEGMDWFIDGPGLVLMLWSDLIELSWLLL